MRNTQITRGFLSVFIMLLVISSLQACKKKIEFSTSAVVPAAEGWVKIKRDKNNNYQVELAVIRLADPKRLTPPKAIYVLWIETQESGPQNIGQLKTSSSLFSKSLRSSLKTLTPHKPLGFFITAEDSINIKSPGKQVVLRTESI